MISPRHPAVAPLTHDLFTDLMTDHQLINRINTIARHRIAEMGMSADEWQIAKLTTEIVADMAGKLAADTFMDLAQL